MTCRTCDIALGSAVPETLRFCQEITVEEAMKGTAVPWLHLQTFPRIMGGAGSCH